MEGLLLKELANHHIMAKFNHRLALKDSVMSIMEYLHLSRFMSKQLKDQTKVK